MKFKDKAFKNETIEIDFNHFSNCQFDGCTFVYHGHGVIGLDGCTFTNVSWNFAGFASNTISFMNALYHGAGEAGKDLIEATFTDIRKKRDA